MVAARRASLSSDNSCFIKAISHITLNVRPEGVSLVGPNRLFVELDLKTYECSRQSRSLQRNRL